MQKEAVYLNNRAVLQKKWPKVLDHLEALSGKINIEFVDDTPQETLSYEGRRLSSCYNRHKEAQTQNSMVPLSARSAHLYGAGLGDAACDLLQRKQLEELYVHILSPTIFYVSLNFFDATSWLSDERVRLQLITVEPLKWPYSVNAAELAFIENHALALRNSIYVDRNKTNQKRLHLVDLAGVYKENLSKNQEFLQHDPYIDTLKRPNSNKKFVVVAGGPTAAKQWSWIKDRRDDYVVIVVNTALVAAEKAGIIPDYVVAIDPAARLGKHFALSNPTQFKDTTLVYLPITSHNAVKLWPGIRLIALTESNYLMQEQIKLHPQSVLYSGGSVAHVTFP